MQLKEFRDFLYNEGNKIRIDKWDEGKRINRDPGADFEMFWVNTFAKGYREAWECSLCRECMYCRECGVDPISACGKYKKTDS